jgi:hypothetical protein
MRLLSASGSTPLSTAAPVVKVWSTVPEPAEAPK